MGAYHSVVNRQRDQKKGKGKMEKKELTKEELIKAYEEVCNYFDQFWKDDDFLFDKSEKED